MTKRHYFYHEPSKTIYHAIEYSNNTGMTYLGSSKHPNLKLGAAAFVQQGKVLTGCKIKEYTEE
jgi:hypothetical protein